MTRLRSHNCGELASNHIGTAVTLMGWVHARRNLGGLQFIDLRDHHGLTQVVINPEAPFFAAVSELRPESVIKIKGKVVRREGAVNTKLATGEIEIVVEEYELESASEILPFPIAHNPKEESDDTRLTYRYLDLRTERMHKNIVFRSKVIQFLRSRMVELGFLEYQTPILTSSSPEGARDFLVPSRLNPGRFYALPQAPQQFKQLLMCSGFDRYFQIAPCFRDEDPRADRSPGEFYQLDIEMSFVTQEEIFTMVEKIMADTFKTFSTRKIKNDPFPRIPYLQSLDLYGSDKPDLRYSLPMTNVENLFANTDFAVFKKTLEGKGILRAIHITAGAAQSRKFFDEADAFAKENGLGGLPYLTFKDGEWKGSCAKALNDQEKSALQAALKIQNGDAVFFILGANKLKTQLSGGKMRTWFADKLNLRDLSQWAFCWIVDFPMFEFNEEEGRIDFCHNPFSMPQGGMDALLNQEPLDILAYQYDIVCNGIELSSGAIRNHKREVMKKAFEIAGYSDNDIEIKFAALWNAFRYGPPPHGGIAPGIDRMIMLLLDEPNIREVIAFPLNQKGQDPMMNAPSEISDRQLKDVHIQCRPAAK